MFTNWADVCVLNRSPGGLLDTGTLAALVLGILIAVLQGGAYCGSCWCGRRSRSSSAWRSPMRHAPRTGWRRRCRRCSSWRAWGSSVCWSAAAPSSRWYRRTRASRRAPGAGGVGGMAELSAVLRPLCGGDGHETAAAMEHALHGGPLRRPRLLHLRQRTARRGDAALLRRPADAGPRAIAERRRRHPSGDVLRRRVAAPVVGHAPRPAIPAAEFAEHRAPDGHLLFTRVDVPITELIAGRAGCAGSARPGRGTHGVNAEL